jgi:hypothetical protein
VIGLLLSGVTLAPRHHRAMTCWTGSDEIGSSASSVLGKQKLRGKHAPMASLSHLLAWLSGSICQQHGTCGRTTKMDQDQFANNIKAGPTSG